MRKVITDNDIVLALKALRTSQPATAIAEYLNTDSRAVATAARKAQKDGRIVIHYRRGKKGEQVRGFYRFVRLKGVYA